jgi:hypothetical protein
MKYSSDDVLRYRQTPANRSTVRRYYAQWRKEQGQPPICDTPACQFHTEPLKWIDKDLPLILDHKNGNCLDNRPKNLRYLCPNCDSQLSTRGGLNRGKVHEANEGTYVLMSREGKRQYHLIAEPGHIRIQGHDAQPAVPPDGPRPAGSARR